jgi:hypothetical protein
MPITSKASTPEVGKHTPGPLKVIGGTSIHKNGREIAACSLTPSVQEAEANASLFAAAPDLLAALEAAKEEIRLIRMKDANVVYNPALQSMMSAAIAKARGV